MLCLFLTSVFAEPNDTVDPKKKDENCSGKNLEGIKPTLSPNSNNEKREGEGCSDSK